MKRNHDTCIASRAGKKPAAPAPSTALRLARSSAFGLRLRTLVLFASTLAGASLAEAQDFPTKPIKVIVTTAAGGLGDTVFRTAADSMAKYLGQPIVIENKPGGSSTLGTSAAVKAPADGHTLVMTSDTSLVVVPLLRTNLPYDAEKDLAVLAPLARIPVGLVVPAKLPVNSVKEFVAYARANPGRLNFASIGAGTSYHLAAEMFFSQEKLDLVHVPYLGGGQMLTSLIRNDTSAAFAGLATFIEQAKVGRVKILAVSGDLRLVSLPNVPTFKESGFPDYQVSAHVGLAAPKATPLEIQRRLIEAVNSALEAPNYRRTLADHGMVVPAKTTPAAYAAELDTERKRWTALISERHITIN